MLLLKYGPIYTPIPAPQHPESFSILSFYKIHLPSAWNFIVTSDIFHPYSRHNISYKYKRCRTVQEAKKFYNQLRNVLDQTPKRDITIVLSNLNANVGSDAIGQKPIMGRHNLGSMNEIGKLNVNFCEQKDLDIDRPIFLHWRMHKVTWTSPDLKTGNQIGHLIVSHCWRTLIDVKVYRDADNPTCDLTTPWWLEN